MAYKKEIWTVSRLKAWQTCPMKEALRYRECLAPKGKKSALAIGSAIHKGIETWDIDEALKLLCVDFPRDQEEADAQEIAIVTVEALLNGYFQRFEPFEEHKPEKPFELRMISDHGRSYKFYIAGKIDDLVEIDGRHWIVEYKTASRLDGSYYDRLYVDSQITMYMYAMERLGYDVAGVIYRVIRKPSLRRGKTESLEQFKGRLIQDIEDRPEFYFEERKLHRSRDDIKTFEKMIFKEASLAEKLYKSGCAFQHSTACSMYGACEYLPLCMGEAGAEAMFEKRPPHEELEEATT